MVARVPPLNVPNPDPSDLTLSMVYHEISNLRQLLEARLDGIDRATEVFQQNLTRVPTEVDKQVLRLRELHDERFSAAKEARNGLAEGIQKQFDERDIRSKASELSAQVAVSAALQAQKEAAAAQNDSNAAAISKSEVATTKQIDGILALLASNTKAIDEKISSTVARLDRSEGGQTSLLGSQSTTIAIVAIIVSIIVGGFSIAAGFARSKESPSPQPAAVAVVPVSPR